MRGVREWCSRMVFKRGVQDGSRHVVSHDPATLLLLGTICSFSGFGLLTSNLLVLLALYPKLKNENTCLRC